LVRQACLIVGWVNYFRIADMKKVLERIDSKIRARIRVIIWKQWKVCAKQIKSLVRLGIKEGDAKGLVWCRKSYQFIEHSHILQTALSNARLNKRGLVFALDQYQKVHIKV